MSIHRTGTKYPMSSIAYHDIRVRQWARDLEDRESLRSGQPLPVARKAVAQRAGVPAGTLENIRRNRVKGLRGWVRDRIQQLVVRELEAEIQRLNHELEIVLSCSAEPDGDAVITARAAIETAREVIKGIS